MVGFPAVLERESVEILFWRDKLINEREKEKSGGDGFSNGFG